MNINRLDLNLLVAFDAIFTEGSITKASIKLNLTQPAISHALGRLRDAFRDPLFVRNGRGLAPTPFARNLIERVRRSLRELEIALAELEQFEPATSTRLFTIGMRDVLEARILPGLVQRMHAAAPSVDLSAIHVDRSELEAKMAIGHVDAALDIWLPLSDRIRRIPLLDERPVVLARQGHPIVRGKLDIDTYLRLDHVQVSARAAGRSFEDLELSRLGLSRRVRLRCRHYFAACRVVSQTDLVLTMSENYARIANEQFGNQILSFPLNIPMAQTFLYWHANLENDAGNEWLRAQIVKAME